MNRITYMDYDFTVTEDDIIFDEELDADKFLDLHDIEEDTLFSISSVDGRLCFTKIYEDDEPEPNEEEYIERNPPFFGNNILSFSRYGDFSSQKNFSR